MRAFVVIPARDEEKRIAKTLGDYSRLPEERKGSRIVVASESSDGTDDIVREFSKKSKGVELLPCRKGTGKGGAIIEGFRYLLKQGDDFAIGFADADDAVSLSQFMRLLKRLESDKRLDGVIASRYVHGGSIEGRLGLGRALASRAYNLLVRLLFRVGFKDTQCGAKVFKASAVREVIHLMDITGMSFDINLLYEMKLKGYRIEEYGVRYRQMNGGTNIRILRNSPQMLVAALGFRVYKSRYIKLFPGWFIRYVYRRIDKW